MLDPRFAMSDADALALVGRVGLLHLAAATPQGPLLRTVDGVVHDGALCFHGGDHGDKLGLLGRDVMVAVEQVVAHLPSWFFDERRACPATTYYRSVHVWGRVERVEAPNDKAAILRALMQRYQPEGRHVPIDPQDPLYAGAIRELMVARVRPTRISAKAKLGQHKGARTIARALQGLWTRGEPGDLAALRTIREAHPARPVLPWLQGPGGVEFEVAPDAREVEAAVALVRDEYWNVGVDPSRIRAAHLA
ncbi:MAG: pyridoxamine 5'-phosphate oxidase family protein, partial [Myxococcales bacterium]|nr:pyridoxamine 5'-phosphate oxidase family protein [Myxococcales bacterium]